MAGLVRTLRTTWPTLLNSVLEPAAADLFAYLQFDSRLSTTAELHGFVSGSVCPAARSAIVEAAMAAPKDLGAKVNEQGRKIGQCFQLIEAHLSASPTRKLYSLILSTRPDVVYPPRPFPFAPLLAAAAGRPDREGRLGHIFIPLCCDNRAITDMMAVGSFGAMRHYMAWGKAKRSPSVTGEQAVARQLEAPAHDGRIELQRFWYEFALLRSSYVPIYEVLGPRVFTEYFHSAAIRSFIVSNASTDSVLNVSTECTFNPAVDISPEWEYELTGRMSRIAGKRSLLLGYPSGARQWRVETMRCAYHPRTCQQGGSDGGREPVCHAPPPAARTGPTRDRTGWDELSQDVQKLV